MQQRINARRLAFSVLSEVEKDGAYSNIALNKAFSEHLPDGRDRAFVTRLVYGVLENKLTLDYQIRQYLRQGIRLKTPVRVLLRLGAYEILYLDGVPARASVNEYVTIARFVGVSYAAGMINAVLRRISEHGLVLPEENEEHYLSVKYSVAPAILSVYEKEFGDETPRFLAAVCGETRIYGRINSLKTDFNGLKDALSAEGIEISPVDGVKDAFYFSDSAAFQSTKAFSQGRFFIQDLSGICAGLLLAPEPGMKILDVCAAPGGKSFSAAIAAGGIGTVISRDLHEHKIALIADQAKRLGLHNIDAQVGDALNTPPCAEFDRVICDVPCSGLGVLRKKPELRYRDLSSMEELKDLQYRILCAAAGALKPGGRMVYSTCTVTREENEAVVTAFLKAHPDYVPVRVPLPYGSESDPGVRFLPQTDRCDGVYACAIERKDS